MSDWISDDCFYDSCDSCEWPACRCHCHADQEFSPLYGWVDVQEDYYDGGAA